MHITRSLILSLAPLCVTLGACGGDPAGSDGSSSSTGGEPVGTTEVEPTTTDAPNTTDVDPVTTADSTDATSEPTTVGPGTDASSSTGDTDGATAGTTEATSEGTTEGSDTGQVEEFVKVQLVALNDLHGHLEPPSGSSGKITLPDNSQVETGGAAYLATRVAALKAENPNTIVVGAGDLIGASPLISALFHDEPTIELMNQIGLQYSAVGNHEFDDGAAELLRMQEGGCHPLDGCQDGTPFPGAEFQYLSANVLVGGDPDDTLLPSYAVHEVGGVKVGFIGMTLEGTPGIVTPIGNEDLVFLDEVDRANALVPELTTMGVTAIVVLLHEGGFQTGYYDECPGISGPIVEIAEGLSDEIDVVVSGHTHQAYNCVIADKIVTSAASFGRVVTDIDLEISTLTGDVTAATAKNVLVTREEADAEVAAFVAGYKTLVTPLANKQLGSITATLERYPPKNGAGLSTMGAVLADAHLAATADPLLGGAQIAFMNPGGVRADMVYAKSGAEPVDGIVTYGEAFAVQPFGNSLVVMTLTGAQIDAVLEQQFAEGLQNNVLHVSKGFKYTYSASAPVGSKVDLASVSLNGAPLVANKKYRVVTLNYLASGGDSFSGFLAGTEQIGGVTDMQALEAYLAAQSPISPPALDRITVVP